MVTTSRGMPVHPKRIAAASRRRDACERPFLTDNEILSADGQEPNPREPRSPRPPAGGTNPERVLAEIRRHTNGQTVPRIAQALDLDEDGVRSAINRLRDPRGWPIWNDGELRFWLDEDALGPTSRA